MMSLRRLVGHLALRAFFPEALIRRKYRAFKNLLERDHLGHGLMTKLEKIYHDGKPVDFSMVRAAYEELVRALSGMADDLADMNPIAHRGLSDTLRRLDVQARGSLDCDPPVTSLPHVLALHEIPAGSERLVGGKASNLAWIASRLSIPVPRGFVITSHAFHYFLECNGIRDAVAAGLAGLDIESPLSLESTAGELSGLIQRSSLPPDLEKAISEGFSRWMDGRTCAVRSSAVGEDSVISFAGQYRSVLNVSRENLFHAYKEVLAGKYSPTALSYRIRHGLLDEDTPMAVLVTEMIDAESSGVAYSRSPLAPGIDTVAVYSVWGLGELLVKGTIRPDAIHVSREAPLRIVERNCAGKELKARLSSKHGIEIVSVPTSEREVLSLDEESARQVASWALRIEEACGTPQDLEWCRDRQGSLILLQARPLGLPEAGEPSPLEEASDAPGSLLLSGGEKAASGVGVGRVVRVFSTSELKHIPEGSILVAPTTSPAFARVVDRLKAVVTDVGSVAGHFASVAREWGVPTLVNTRIATQVMEPGEIVTVDADSGKVFAGIVEDLVALSRQGEWSLAGAPLGLRLRSLLTRVSPLNLLDPRDRSFSERNCETLHDFLRYAHEKAVEEMFALGGRGRRKIRGARKLSCEIPIVLYVLDLGGGLREGAQARKEVTSEDVASEPLRALWEGLTGFREAWSSHVVHFDWGDFNRMSMGEGIVSFDSQLLASFALISPDYLNANIRFGYHFAVIDALLGSVSRDNYVSLNFEGGGAEFEGRHLRSLFVAQVLGNHGFEVHLERDSVHARAQKGTVRSLGEKLGLIGRILAYTPFLDMVLKDLSDVGRLVGIFSGHSSGSEERDEAPSPPVPGPFPSDSSGGTGRGVLVYRPTWVSDQLAVGHAPMSYEELGSLREQGIDAIVNLCAEYPDLYPIEKGYGFDVFYLPVVDDRAPGMKEMEEALAWLDEAVYVGKKVLIHCRLGVGRTGTFLMSYFVRRGFGLEETEERLKRLRSRPTSTTQWKLLKQYDEKEGKLTIREPTLEGEHPVDLGLYFAEYEALLERIEEDASAVPGDFDASVDGATGMECCRRFFHVQLMEAVYLRHHLVKHLSREDRLAAVHRAIASDRLVQDETAPDGESLIPVVSAGVDPFAQGDPSMEAAEYLCPLNVAGKCIVHPFRPIGCRVCELRIRRSLLMDGNSGPGASVSVSGLEGAPASTRNEALHEMSRQLFFSLNGIFLEGKALLFPITDVVSGKFIQDYFTLLTHMDGN